MSRRDSLATVLRVAELRERVARGAASADVAAEQRTRLAEVAAHAHLATLPREGDLRLAASRAALRARSVLEAQRATEDAHVRSTASVAAYVDQARRTALLAELVARKATERELRIIAAEQRVADDLAGLRLRVTP